MRAVEGRLRSICLRKLLRLRAAGTAGANFITAAALRSGCFRSWMKGLVSEQPATGLGQAHAEQPGEGSLARQARSVAAVEILRPRKGAGSG